MMRWWAIDHKLKGRSEVVLSFPMSLVQVRQACAGGSLGTVPIAQLSSVGGEV